jgi:polar amino acid transport system ATP-binding protein
MIRIEGVCKAFRSLQVLEDVSLRVPKGSFCIVIGPSGSGKSTLLKCINFLEPYDKGSIYIEEELVGFQERDGQRRLRPRQEIAKMRSEACMVFQQFNLFTHMTAMENVMTAPIKVKRIPRPEAATVAERLLIRVGLKERMHAYPGFLSGGEQQRVAIARALAMEPKVILLDEVTSALDPELVAEVLEVIRKLAEEGMTMIVVTHEMEFAREIAHQVVFMDGGRVIERGGSEILDDPQTQRLQGFLGKLNRREKPNS